MKVTIVGSGYSGIATAVFLNSMGVKKKDILILEKKNTIGGLMSTVKKDGYIIETGPEGIRGNATKANEIIDIVGAREISVNASEIAANRFLIHKGKLKRLPLGPVSALTTPLISFGGKIRILMEPFIKNQEIPEETSIGELFERRFGKGIDNIIDAFISGVYAGDHRKLSANFVFPILSTLEKEYGSIIRGGIKMSKAKRKERGKGKKEKKPFLINFNGGMSQLVEKMSEGFNILTNQSVHSVDRQGDRFQVVTEETSYQTDTVVIATSPNNTPLINLENGSPKCPETPTAPVAVVAMGFDKNQLLKKPEGYGFLSPSKEERFVLGTLFTSDVFPHHAPKDKVLLRTIIGGRRHPEYVSLTDSEIRERVLDDLNDLIGIRGEPEMVEIIKHPVGIPQLELGHGRIDAFRREIESKNRGIYFNAIGWNGIATAHLAEEAFRVSQNIMEILGN